MSPWQGTPPNQSTPARMARYTSWLAQVSQQRSFQQGLSWFCWLLAVALFALWTLEHASLQDATPWLGMTIHTTVFAIWTLVLRERLMLR